MEFAWRSVVDGCVLICLLCRVFFKVRANRRVGKSKDPKTRVPEIAVPDLVFSILVPCEAMASANGVTYRSYEAAVANIFTKCADVATDDCPLPHFPPRVSKLPPLPDDQTLSEITSGISAAIPIDEGGHQNSSTAAVNNDQISAKCTSRLARKRLPKKRYWKVNRTSLHAGRSMPCLLPRVLGREGDCPVGERGKRKDSSAA